MSAFKKLGTLVAVGVVATVSVFGATSAANAAPSNIDINEPVTFTVHKFAKTPANGLLPGDGLEAVAGTTTGWQALEGVEFTLQEVTEYDGDIIDLTDTASWDAIPTSNTFDPGLATFGTTIVGDGTDVNGEETFDATDGLTQGLYWVTETGSGTNNISDPIAPFLVTLPMQGATPGTWNYNVHAYPKNSVTGANMALNVGTAKSVNDTVTWDLTGTVPHLSGQGINTFEFITTLPTDLTYAGAPGDLTVELEDALGTPVALTSGLHYNVVNDVATDGSLDVVFTSDGRTLLEANQGGVVTVSVVTALNAIADYDATYTANVNVNSAVMPLSDTIDLGGIEINKWVAGTTVPQSVALEDAVFSVYPTLADAQAGTNVITTGTPGNLTNEFTTDVNGEAVAAGLITDATGVSFWVVEVEAPSGYIGDSTPREVVVTAGANALVNFENTQRNNSAIPALGSTGLAVAGIAVIAILGAAAFVGGRVLRGVSNESKTAA